MQDGRSLQRRVSLATILTSLGWPAISPSPMCAGYIKTSLVAAGGLLDLGEADLVYCLIEVKTCVPLTRSANVRWL